MNFIMNHAPDTGLIAVFLVKKYTENKREGTGEKSEREQDKREREREIFSEMIMNVPIH